MFAASNDLTATLQRGLFEEEANRNLDAAAQAYQAVSTQFDKDRAHRTDAMRAQAKPKYGAFSKPLPDLAWPEFTLDSALKPTS